MNLPGVRVLALRSCGPLGLDGRGATDWAIAAPSRTIVNAFLTLSPANARKKSFLERKHFFPEAFFVGVL
jgi:hypothetical protein